MCLSFDVNVVSGDVPVLPGLLQMYRLGNYFNNLNNCLIHPASGILALTVRLFVHAFIQWSPHIAFHFTNVRLCWFNFRFEHHGVNKWNKLLEPADVDSVNFETRRALSKIKRKCQSCQTNAERPAVASMCSASTKTLATLSTQTRSTSTGSQFYPSSGIWPTIRLSAGYRQFRLKLYIRL